MSAARISSQTATAARHGQNMIVAFPMARRRWGRNRSWVSYLGGIHREFIEGRRDRVPLGAEVSFVNLNWPGQIPLFAHPVRPVQEADPHDVMKMAAEYEDTRKADLVIRGAPFYPGAQFRAAFRHGYDALSALLPPGGRQPRLTAMAQRNGFSTGKPSRLLRRTTVCRTPSFV